MEEKGQGMPATKSGREAGQEKWTEPSVDRHPLSPETVEKVFEALLWVMLFVREARLAI